MAEGKQGEILIAFESGHYKKIEGVWKGDSVWSHFNKVNGGMIHINKEKVEYMEIFETPKLPESISTLPLTKEDKIPPDIEFQPPLPPIKTEPVLGFGSKIIFNYLGNPVEGLILRLAGENMVDIAYKTSDATYNTWYGSKRGEGEYEWRPI